MTTSLRSHAAQLLRLSRAKMTVVSAVTYLAGALHAPTFHALPFLRGWLFILLTQFATHFLGEVFDAPSDALNKHSTALTGGSKVLPRRHLSPAVAVRYAVLLLAVAALSIPLLLAPALRPLAAAMLAAAAAYSAPPLLLNHRALGELDAAVITSLLVPYFAFAVQRATVPRFPWFHPRLQFLTLPPFFVKLALFLVLNLADRRPDWATGKLTLPVILGTRRTAVLHAALMAAAYLAALGLALRLVLLPTPNWREASVLFFILPSAPYGLAISRALLAAVPYRLDHLLAPTLLHSTFLVWGVLTHAWLQALPRQGIFNFQTAFAVWLAYTTVSNILQGRSRSSKKNDQPNSLAADLPLHGDHATQSGNQGEAFVNVRVSFARKQEVAARSAEEAVAVAMEGEPLACDVTVVGAGVAGLVAAAALTKMGRSVLVLERRASATEAETGADLALWPGAIAILKELGVPSAFFDSDCFPLEKVHMCNMDFAQIGEGLANAATVLKTIDMKQVTEGTGGRFVLLSRQRLMQVLREIVPSELLIYGAQVVDVEEDEDDESVTTVFSLDPSARADGARATTASVKSRIVIGADGARSILRAHVSPSHGGRDAVRFCGEVCYRGVLELGKDAGISGEDALLQDATRLFPDKPSERTMRINYGAGLRSSFGHMSADGGQAYWWVKVQTDEPPENKGKLDSCKWPEPLKTLHDITPEEAFYMHPIEDSHSLPKWSSPRVVLVGDAAHVVTPNMGQGACLAAEDAFVLAIELAKYWRWPDGHLEAFYNYEQTRRPYAEGVASDARKQLFLGQLQSRPAVFLRELLLKLVPTSVLEKNLQRNNFPVQSYLQVFQNEMERI